MTKLTFFFLENPNLKIWLTINVAYHDYWDLEDDGSYGWCYVSLEQGGETMTTY